MECVLYIKFYAIELTFLRFLEEKRFLKNDSGKRVILPKFIELKTGEFDQLGPEKLSDLCENQTYSDPTYAFSTVPLLTRGPRNT